MKKSNKGVVAAVLDTPDVEQDTCQSATVVGEPTQSANNTEVRPDRFNREFQIDGDTVVFNAKQSIVLRCGEASITLQSDGKVVIRGIHVISHAKGVNRIRGGSVQLN